MEESEGKLDPEGSNNKSESESRKSEDEILDAHVNYESCPICLENVLAENFNNFPFCCHGVCVTCDTKFKEEYVRCPICRSPIHEQLHFAQKCLDSMNEQSSSLLEILIKLKSASQTLPKDSIINEKSKILTQTMERIVREMTDMRIFPSNDGFNVAPGLNELDVLAYLGAAVIEEGNARQEVHETQLASLQNIFSSRNSVVGAQSIPVQPLAGLNELMANLLENFAGHMR